VTWSIRSSWQIPGTFARNGTRALVLARCHEAYLGVGSWRRATPPVVSGLVCTFRVWYLPLGQTPGHLNTMELLRIWPRKAHLSPDLRPFCLLAILRECKEPSELF
jgi:hypothetical protein